MQHKQIQKDLFVYGLKSYWSVFGMGHISFQAHLILNGLVNMQWLLEFHLPNQVLYLVVHVELFRLSVELVIS